jgi:hypothetical protein
VPPLLSGEPGIEPAIGSGAQVAQAEDALCPQRSAEGGWVCAADAAGRSHGSIPLALTQITLKNIDYVCN